MKNAHTQTREERNEQGECGEKEGGKGGRVYSWRERDSQEEKPSGNKTAADKAEWSTKKEKEERK